MIALLKKDWGVYRTLTIGSVSIILAIYVIAALTLLGNDRPTRPSDVIDAFYGAGFMGLLVSAILAGMYGSGALSLERRDRSADFLAMMPTSRARIVASKAIIAIGCAVLIWLINLSEILIVFPQEVKGQIGRMPDLFNIVIVILGAGVMFFGTSWLLSTFLNSAALAFGIGIMFVVGSLTLIGTWQRRHEISDVAAQEIFCAWTFGMGIICFITGVIYYLRRVEP